MSRPKVAAVRIMMIHLNTEIHECNAMAVLRGLFLPKDRVGCL